MVEPVLVQIVPAAPGFKALCTSDTEWLSEAIGDPVKHKQMISDIIAWKIEVYQKVNGDYFESVTAIIPFQQETYGVIFPDGHAEDDNNHYDNLDDMITAQVLIQREFKL